jgi:DNA helicase-2/ATP-dependent DNA helicase PcrA
MLADLVENPRAMPHEEGGDQEKAAESETPVPVEAPGAPPIVVEEEQLLTVVLRKLDGGAPRKTRVQVDDASTLIELRDALAEAKPEDQGSLLEQMHRIEALSRQRGKGDTPPVDRKSPYFGHLRLSESGKRRDVLIGARSYVEPGGGVQIVDWRNAPVSRLFYRYEEGDGYEERLGDRLVEGEILARRTVAIVEAELRRVASPEGTYSRDLRTGAWRQVAGQRPKLHIARDGSSASIVPGLPGPKPAGAPPLPAPAPRGKLGLDESGLRRPDRHLPAIAALIDPRQFELITQPTSGLIAVQGSAGSGKTTIGLHRIAYLAFAEPRRFRPEKMLVIVYQRALAAYVSRVLPSLDVDGVPVLTFTAWAEAVRKAALPSLDASITDDTPPLVMRAKAHGAMLRILDDRQAALRAWCRAHLEKELAGRADPGVATAALAAWDAAPGSADERVTALAQWVRDTTVDLASRSALEGAGRAMRARTRDVVGEWANLLTDRQALREGFERHAPGLFSPGQLDDIHRWCVERDRLRGGAGDDDEPYAIDAEDDALLLRIYQLQRGRLPGGKAPLAYEHLMVDEVQDFSPLELAVLLDTTTRARSVTLAGDTAQAIAPDHGFSNWSELLDDLGIAHERIEPLRVSYRSTREIVDSAEHVLGPLQGDVRPVAPRAGAPVEAFGFGSTGECAEFLSHALKELVRVEPEASVALVARHAEQARAYYEALARAEVPALRLVADQDFPFVPGLDVTDVRQTKGLEFDIVILLEVSDASYPASDESRRLLHVAMTRAAHQLWVTYTGAPSALLPDSLR